MTDRSLLAVNAGSSSVRLDLFSGLGRVKQSHLRGEDIDAAAALRAFAEGRVRVFGIAASLSFLAAYAIYAMWFISVWCLFAAVLSVIVLLHFTNRISPSKESTHGMVF